jgi:3'(2'), 5'-bisphosphate nucleotidase
MDRREILDSISPRLQKLLLIVREAGKKVMGVYADDFNVVFKPDLSPLTLADGLSHETLFRSLPGIFPCPVLSEEGRAVPYKERSEWNSFWSIDPLDGTKEFVRKSGEFCISVALVVGKTPIFGIIYIPVCNQLYFGGEGFGSYRMEKPVIDSLEHQDSMSLLQISDLLNSRISLSNRGWILLRSVSHGLEIPPDIMNALHKKASFETLSVGSAIKFCRIAEGTADFYPRYGTTMEWDTSAGDAIVRGAGGGLITIGTGRPLNYNKLNLENPDFYCFSGRFQEDFPEILSQSS